MPIYTIKTPKGRQVEIEAADESSAIRGAQEWEAGHEQKGGVERGIENTLKPFTGYFPTQMRLAKEGMEDIGHGVEQLMGDTGGGVWERTKGVGNIALGTLGYLGSGPNAAVRSFLSQPVENTTGLPKEYTEFAAGVLPFMRGRPPTLGNIPGFRTLPDTPTTPPRVPPAIPPAIHQRGGVTLSEGQGTRDLTTIQEEQRALRGQSGPAAQRQAQAFADQQQAQVAAERGGIVEGLGLEGTAPVENAREAADIVQRGLQRESGRARAAVDTAYATARGLPGEIHAGAFEGMPQRIKGQLTLGEEPVVIDDVLTPWASRMIKDLDTQVGRLRIQNRADPFGAPNPERITGVSLNGVEQWRKRLSTFRNDAHASGNAADARAARAVLDAFDEQVTNAVNGGLFRGDPRAIQAWNDARAAHADYRATFRQGRSDPIGRVVEKIVGRNANNPAAIPNDVADFIYGAAGTNPSSLNVAVVNRLRQIFPEGSQEWAAIRQGLFQRLTDAGEGMRPFSPGTVSQRLNKFLNNDGVEMSRVLFSPAERRMMQEYSDLLRRLEVPQAGANWSNTATFAGRGGHREGRFNWLYDEMAAIAGNLVGGTLGHVPGLGRIGHGLAARIADMPEQRRTAAQIARQMPVLADLAERHIRATHAFHLSPVLRNAQRLSLTGNALADGLGKLDIPMPSFLRMPEEGSAQ